MINRVAKVGIGQTTKFAVVFYALVGVLYVPLLYVINSASAPEEQIPGVVVLLMPFVFALVGLIVFPLGCLLYNLAAGWVGGIEVVLQPRD